eukprot:TRINITY_DN21581_c0_g1_i3.p2 TRINITY_DN21581_c0_g1~~TRINITY_DN21581_c0_g1_i3.p2  ORF type:complete len:142 (+),score=23.66 TRINITY_DN21581_c0_g1_i3:209-634(+)
MGSKLLYLDPRNQFEFTIHYGSGIFAIQQNDTSIVDLKYDSKISPRSIVVIPKKEGFVEISVEDIGVASTISAKCIVIVSNIYSVLLEQDLLLEQGTNSTLSVSFFTLNNEELPQEQYKYCLLYTSPSPRDLSTSRMPSSA